ncbi:uncharacterized protein EAF02_001287 [Botrytis sinoallii]|uniref:uncharacterized protein n=1 Tax=Botrytis sinoallii TaxID=1463999 RepID=UPI0018FFA96C|nr:uncharacterized protein EAF02_001287 [Botrytis sinoallii]KAF7890962.1 hypothetical protein EAF02_001287 [Botrytis sinoallii]
MKHIIFSQVFLGIISLILGSPLSTPWVRSPSKCGNSDLNTCTVEVYVPVNKPNQNKFDFIVKLFDSNCDTMCGDRFVHRNTRITWVPPCLKGGNMTVQVQGDGELQPIYHNGSPIYIGIVPDGNPTIVTHRDTFQCPKANAALAVRSVSDSGENL